MTDRRTLFTVRSPRGKLRHIMADYGSPENQVLCGRYATSWTIEPDDDPDCEQCLRETGN